MAPLCQLLLLLLLNRGQLLGICDLPLELCGNGLLGFQGLRTSLLEECGLSFFQRGPLDR